MLWKLLRAHVHTTAEPLSLCVVRTMECSADAFVSYLADTRVGFDCKGYLILLSYLRPCCADLWKPGWLGWAGLGWAGLGSALLNLPGLGWAGLGRTRRKLSEMN
jgi:hypothetical protein